MQDSQIVNQGLIPPDFGISVSQARGAGMDAISMFVLVVQSLLTLAFLPYQTPIPFGHFRHPKLSDIEIVGSGADGPKAVVETCRQMWALWICPAAILKRFGRAVAADCEFGTVEGSALVIEGKFTFRGIDTAVESSTAAINGAVATVDVSRRDDSDELVPSGQSQLTDKTDSATIDFSAWPNIDLQDIVNPADNKPEFYTRIGNFGNPIPLHNIFGAIGQAIIDRASKPAASRSKVIPDYKFHPDAGGVVIEHHARHGSPEQPSYELVQHGLAFIAEMMGKRERFVEADFVMFHRDVPVVDGRIGM